MEKFYNLWALVTYLRILCDNLFEEEFVDGSVITFLCHLYTKHSSRFYLWRGIVRINLGRQQKKGLVVRNL